MRSYYNNRNQKNTSEKIKKLFFDSDYRFQVFATRGLHNYMDDGKYIKKMFKYMMGYDLDLDNPKTFNEKIQWLKLYDRRPEYTMMVDKYEVRKYIADKLGKEYLIPLLGVWDNPDEIDFASLPNQFVLKCNHNSGLGMCICKDKSALNIARVKEKLRKGLKQNYYLTAREWPYKNVQRRIIGEKYMVHESKPDKALVDYKFFCFNGVADSVMVCLDRETGNPKFYFFDKKWNLKRYNEHGKDTPHDFTLPRPRCIETMFSIAEILSEGIPYVRVDLYYINGKTYFGELTFFPDSGFDSNLLMETDYYWGNMLVLPERKGNKIYENDRVSNQS